MLSQHRIFRRILPISPAPALPDESLIQIYSIRQNQVSNGALVLVVAVSAYSDEVGRRFRANAATPRSGATQALQCYSVVAGFRFLRQPFAHRFSLQGDRIGIVHEPVKDRIGERRLPDGGMPVLDRELTGDHGRPPAMAII